MERGPLALFGAIVAVGLGPALWLGAQFGDVAVSPTAPPAVISEQLPDAGGGAGAAPDDSADKIETTRQAEVKPLTDRPAPRRSSTATTTAPEPDGGPATTPPATSEPTKPDEPTTPPTEDTTDEPTTPPAGDDDSGDGDDNGTDPGDVEPPLPPDPNTGGAGPVLAGT